MKLIDNLVRALQAGIGISGQGNRIFIKTKGPTRSSKDWQKIVVHTSQLSEYSGVKAIIQEARRRYEELQGQTVTNAGGGITTIKPVNKVIQAPASQAQTSTSNAGMSSGALLLLAAAAYYILK